MKMKPKNWLEFFEFIRYSKVKGMLKEMALAAAKAGMDSG
jgi:hypothetical protein